jgi:hypothetical protein
MAVGLNYRQCLIIWVWLVVLLLASIGANTLPVSPMVLGLIIFGTAVGPPWSRRFWSPSITCTSGGSISPSA